MSSRVQKGGQKFKPILKARGHPTEVSPNVPTRKPLSAAEPLRAPSEKPNTQSTEIPHHSIAPSAVDFSGPGQHDDLAVSRKPSHPTPVRRSKRIDSGSVPVHDGTVDTSVSSDVTNDVTVRISGEVQRIHDVDVIPREGSSMSDLQGPQAENLSNVLFATHQIVQVPVTSGVQSPHPISVQDRSRGADVRSQAESTVQERVSGPEWRQQVIQQGPGTREGHIEEEISSRSKRRTRRRVRGSDDENADLADDLENIVKATTKRMQGPPRSSSTASGHTEAHTGTQDGTDQALRRSNRRRRSNPVPSELQDGSESVLDGHESALGIKNRLKRRRGSSTVSSITGTRGGRPKNMVIWSPDAEPGDELDPTVVTMATICDDTGQGRVSSKAAIIQRNHLAWKLANKQKRELMRLNMEAKKYGKKAGEGTSQEGVTQPDKDKRSDASEPQAQEVGTAAIEDESGSGFNYKEALPVNRFTAQVRIGPNGETIIDEDSLFVDRADHADDANETYQHVEESDQTKFTNSASYSRRPPRSPRWSAEETELFYDALSQFGENYELISYVLPGRDRKACKAKFKAEDRKNPGRITYCLNNRIPYDMQTLSRLTGRDFSGPVPEIVRAPEPPPATETPTGLASEPEAQRRSEPDSEERTRQPRKKSRAPAMSDDVEVVGDVETFESDV